MQTPNVEMAIWKTLIRPIDVTDSAPEALAEPFVPSEGAEELTADSVFVTSTNFLVLGKLAEGVTHQGLQATVDELGRPPVRPVVVEQAPRLVGVLPPLPDVVAA